MAALNRAQSLRCLVRSAGAGSVVEGLAFGRDYQGGELSERNACFNDPKMRGW
jgi:hypothetical protein